MGETEQSMYAHQGTWARRLFSTFKRRQASDKPMPQHHILIYARIDETDEGRSNWTCIGPRSSMHNVIDSHGTLHLTPVPKSYGIWKLLTQALMTFHKDIVG